VWTRRPRSLAQRASACYLARMATLRRVWGATLDLVYPRRCPGCGTLCRDGFCASCLADLIPVTVVDCSRCGRPGGTPAPAREVGGRCGPGRGCARARGAYLHLGPLREAVRRHKFDGWSEAGETLADLLVSSVEKAPDAVPWPLADLPLGEVDLVCPVPLHVHRDRQRGFNQSARLAERLAAALGVPCDTRLLRRVRETRPQPGLSQAERERNVEGAFMAVPGRLPVAGARLLLVDDVMTTGATFSSCATALRTAGAIRVWALALSRAGRDQDGG